MAEAMVQEVEWFADDSNAVIDLVERDRTDND